VTSEYRVDFVGVKVDRIAGTRWRS
jgi:hypothetical protein